MRLVGRLRPLLPLPAVGDNAAMDEPPNAEPPKRKRRWFQFSLRSLLIMVTLFCAVIGGYVRWQANIVKERQTWIDSGSTGNCVPEE